MSNYLKLEYRLAMRPWTWVVLMISTALRITQVISPTSGWLSFLSIAYPLVIFALAMHLVDQEQRWRTKPVLVAAPCSTHGVLALRFVLLSIPLLALPFVILSPLAALEVVAPAVLLAAAALTAGIHLGVELGSGLGFAWWSLSFVAFFTATPESPRLFNWFSVITSPQISQDEQMVLWMARLGVALALLVWPVVGRLIRRARALAHQP